MVTLSNPLKWLKDWFDGTDRDGGEITVGNESMLGSAAIWYAINTIAGDIAKMPIEPKRLLGNQTGSEVAVNNPAWRLLRDESNDYQTSDVFKEQIQAHALSWGNGRAYIARDGAGTPTALIPLRPDVTDSFLVDGQKYHVTMPDADDALHLYETVQSGDYGKVVVMPDRNVLHIMGFSYDGVKGKSLAKVARDSIGIDLQSQRYSKRQMAKGMAAKLMLEDTTNIFQDEDDAARFLEGFRKNYSNEKEGQVAGLLRGGIKANVLNMSNTDAQFIESRQFQRQEVMLWFGLQHIPGDNSSVSYNSLEQKQLAYLASCLDRWLVRWEMQCDSKLRTEAEKRDGSVYFKFNRGTWLATDLQTTADVLQKLVMAKIINQNEARDKLDKNPVEGGDVFENPAIQVQQPAAPTEQPQTGQQSAAIRNRLQHLLKVESKRAINASTSKDYIEWADKFYAGWQERFGDAIEELGGDRELAQDYCQSHKNDLLALYSTATADEFKPAIQQKTSEWSIEQLLEMILEDL